MTDDEKRLQRAQLIVDLEDAQADLAHLSEKANRYADGLRLVVDLLQRNTRLKPSATDFTVEGDIANRIPPQFQDCLDYSGLLRVVEELKGARQKVFNLQQRQAQLTPPTGMRIA